MKLDKFCGCCSLRTGSLIIGVLNLLLVIAGIIGVSITISHVQKIINYFYSLQDEQSMYSFQLVKSLYVGFLLYILILVVIAILFVVGILKKKSLFVLPSVSVGFVNLLIAFSADIGVLSLVCSTPYLQGGVIFLVFVIVIVSFSVQFYFWLVIFSFYQELISEKSGQLPVRHDIVLH